ncbi:MAG: hypothetical protein RR628_01970 [Clostridium sp.]
MKISQDIDARVGHKSVDTSFFGYKSHIAMTEKGNIEYSNENNIKLILKRILKLINEK